MNTEKFSYLTEVTQVTRKKARLKFIPSEAKLNALFVQPHGFNKLQWYLLTNEYEKYLCIVSLT